MILNKKWDIVLKDVLNSLEFKNLIEKVKDEYQKETIYPKYEDIFNAFNLVDYDDVRVVILGQDPYHGENEAMGLSFSVPEGVKRPPSLNNIFKELFSDLGIKKESNDLTSWAQEGVLLLNTILTVKKDKPLSHKDIGWQYFTDKVILSLNNHPKNIVFILWGSNAIKYEKLIDKRHHIIKSSHPSPLSAHRGFYGSKPFSTANSYLTKKINWVDK